MKHLDRNDKIRDLRAKNMRNSIIKELSRCISNINFDSFLSVNDTKLLSSEVYEKVDIAEIKILLDKDHVQCRNTLYSYRNRFIDIGDKKGILLHYLDQETGAIILRVEDFFNNVDTILNFVKFYEGHRDMVFVAKNMEFGVCIERYEYYNELTLWF